MVLFLGDKGEEDSFFKVRSKLNFILSKQTDKVNEAFF